MHVVPNGADSKCQRDANTEIDRSTWIGPNVPGLFGFTHFKPHFMSD